MSSQAKKLLEQVLALPLEDRAALLEPLNESVRAHDRDLSPEWRSEVLRRIAAVESGDSELISGDQVLASVRARLASLT